MEDKAEYFLKFLLSKVNKKVIDAANNITAYCYHSNILFEVEDDVVAFNQEISNYYFFNRILPHNEINQFVLNMLKKYLSIPVAKIHSVEYDNNNFPAIFERLTKKFEQNYKIFREEI